MPFSGWSLDAAERVLELWVASTNFRCRTSIFNLTSTAFSVSFLEIDNNGVGKYSLSNMYFVMLAKFQDHVVLCSVLMKRWLLNSTNLSFSPTASLHRPWYMASSTMYVFKQTLRSSRMINVIIMPSIKPRTNQYHLWPLSDSTLWFQWALAALLCSGALQIGLHPQWHQRYPFNRGGLGSLSSIFIF